MKIDLFLIGDGFHNEPSEVPAVLSGYAAEAEASDFDAVWFAEHHFIRYGACPSVPLLASHVLARTTRLRVGAAACVLSNRNPVALAEEAVMLDSLSGGRFLLGLARGSTWVDLEVFGTGMERFARGFTPTLDVLRDWLYGESKVSADGEFCRFRAVDVRARPDDALPLWIAATSHGTVDIAASRGIPLLLGVHADDDQKAALVSRWNEVAHQHGHDPSRAEHAAVYVAMAAKSHGAGRQRLQSTMTDWYSAGVGDYTRLDGSRGESDQKDYVDSIISRGLVGPVSDSAEQLAAVTENTGISRILLLVEGQKDPAAVRENIAALGAGLNG